MKRAEIASRTRMPAVSGMKDPLPRCSCFMLSLMARRWRRRHRFLVPPLLLPDCLPDLLQLAVGFPFMEQGHLESVVAIRTGIQCRSSPVLVLIRAGEQGDERKDTQGNGNQKCRADPQEVPGFDRPMLPRL